MSPCFLCVWVDSATFCGYLEHEAGTDYDDDGVVDGSPNMGDKSTVGEIAWKSGKFGGIPRTGKKQEIQEERGIQKIRRYLAKTRHPTNSGEPGSLGKKKKYWTS